MFFKFHGQRPALQLQGCPPYMKVASLKAFFDLGLYL